MRLKSAFVISVFLVQFCQYADAGVIPFELRNNPAVEAADEVASFKLSVSGIEATLSANIGVLNQSSDGFGVNAPGSGDPTSRLDGVNGTESISVMFDQDVFFESLTLAVYSPGETASLTIGSASPIQLDPVPADPDLYLFSANNFVAAGQSVVLTHGSGNGFSFDAFSVSSPVPEPSSALIFLGAVGLAATKRRRRVR